MAVVLIRDCHTVRIARRSEGEATGDVRKRPTLRKYFSSRWKDNRGVSDGMKLCNGVTLVLDFPPSANTYYRSFRGRIVISQAGHEYKAHVEEAVGNLDSSTLPMIGRLSVRVQLQAPTRRKYDIDNRAKPLLDALENAGVFSDDESVDQLLLVRGQVIKHGMCVVQVDYMPE